jgi:hypothetical protein
VEDNLVEYMTGSGKPSEDAEIRDRLEEEAKMVAYAGSEQEAAGSIWSE